MLAREGPGEGANVLSGGVGNPEKNTLGGTGIANGNGIWRWGNALYIGKAGARPASSVTLFVRKVGSSS